jgi:hypothetical protein
MVDASLKHLVDEFMCFDFGLGMETVSVSAS